MISVGPLDGSTETVCVASRWQAAVSLSSLAPAWKRLTAIPVRHRLHHSKTQSVPHVFGITLCRLIVRCSS
ncbi:unnamed protein product [Macrosiphum euphorbiae]|uniref:Uncharacterized protein n=1 Tax=Macrosiphum euphorbiae TaxID=13131 RepID=A0AAV0WKQ0_9HEMI|nr:unnamed protein product [Macrosiphum euphorbiae]